MAAMQVGDEIEFWSPEIVKDGGWQTAICRGIAKIKEITDDGKVAFDFLPQGVKTGDIMVMKEIS